MSFQKHLITGLFLSALPLCPAAHAEEWPTGRFIVPPPSDDEVQAEKIIGTADFIKLRNLSKSDPNYQLSRKVGQLKMPGSSCTGFLVGPALFLTNEHCYEVRKPSAFSIYMQYYQDRNRGPRSAGVRRVLKFNKYLDYALFELDRPIGKTLGWLKLESSAANIGKIRRVKIIQHPNGRSKEIVLKNNTIVRIKPPVVHYIADTMGGSSGSPVFGLRGARVIALHHVGTRRYNEGVRMIEILREIGPLLPGYKVSPKPIAKKPTPTPVKRRVPAKKKQRKPVPKRPPCTANAMLQGRC